MYKNIVFIPPYYNGTSFQDIVQNIQAVIEEYSLPISLMGSLSPKDNEAPCGRFDTSSEIIAYMESLVHLFKLDNVEKVLFLDFFAPAIDAYQYTLEINNKAIKKGALIHGGTFVPGDLYDWQWLKSAENFISFAVINGLNLDHIADERDFREILWELVSTNIITVGYNSSNATLPYFSLTRFGEQCLNENRILPYDIEGFLYGFYDEVADIDDIIKLYLEESVSCFSKKQYLSSVVMIGVALERAVIVLTENFETFLPDTVDINEYKQNVLSKYKIKTRFDSFSLFLKDNKIQDLWDRTQREKFDSLLPAIFNLIRITRNETGHPTGRIVSIDEAESYILLAKQAIIFIYELLEN